MPILQIEVSEEHLAKMRERGDEPRAFIECAIRSALEAGPTPPQPQPPTEVVESRLKALIAVLTAQRNKALDEIAVRDADKLLRSGD